MWRVMMWLTEKSNEINVDPKRLNNLAHFNFTFNMKYENWRQELKICGKLKRNGNHTKLSNILQKNALKVIDYN